MTPQEQEALELLGKQFIRELELSSHLVDEGCLRRAACLGFDSAWEEDVGDDVGEEFRAV